MVYRGTTLVLVLQKGGRELTVLVPPSDDVLEPALGIYRFLLGREFSPQSSLSVETINDTGTLASPYAEALRHVGFTNDYRGMSLWKR
jgi:ATP-dependent Lhr-like helicase